MLSVDKCSFLWQSGLSFTLLTVKMSPDKRPRILYFSYNVIINKIWEED